MGCRLAYCLLLRLVVALLEMMNSVEPTYEQSTDRRVLYVMTRGLGDVLSQIWISLCGGEMKFRNCDR
jgi:hypothetical protein